MQVIQTNTICPEFGDDVATLKILEILIDNIGLRHEELKPGTELAALGVDSLDVVEVVMELEDAFDIEIQDEELHDVNTIQDLIHVVNEHISLKTA